MNIFIHGCVVNISDVSAELEFLICLLSFGTNDLGNIINISLLTTGKTVDFTNPCIATSIGEGQL